MKFFINYVLYACLLFLYIISRLCRDVLIITSLGAEITGFVKLISIIFVVFYSILQRKLLKNYSPKKILICNLIFFSICYCVFFFNLIPELNYDFGFSIKQINGLLNKLPKVFFYIVTELISLMISINFWLWNNQSYTKDSISIFAINQIAILLAASLCLFFPSIPLNYLHIYLIPVFIGLLIVIPSKDMGIQKQNKNTYSPKMILSVIATIPLITFCSGMISGIIDPLWKFNIKSIYPDPHLFLKFTAKVWIAQSLIIISAYFFIRNLSHIRKYLTPISIIFFGLILFITHNFFHQNMLVVTTLCMILYKCFKYTAHSSWKENYLRTLNNMQDILIFDAPATKYGKIFTAIVSSIIFSFGYNWLIYSPYAIIFMLLIGVLWLVLVRRIE